MSPTVQGVLCALAITMGLPAALLAGTHTERRWFRTCIMLVGLAAFFAALIRLCFIFDR